jgi:hypothetical protein
VFLQISKFLAGQQCAKAGIHVAPMQSENGLTSFAVVKRLRFRGNDGFE